LLVAALAASVPVLAPDAAASVPGFAALLVAAFAASVPVLAPEAPASVGTALDTSGAKAHEQIHA
jgi:hypothetical protein